MAVTWLDQPTDPIHRAHELVAHINAGGTLPALDTDLLLDDGEALHIQTSADLWWYGAMDIPHERHSFVAFGGYLTFALTAAASAYGNHRRRTSARQLAAPQWRHLGHTPIHLTNQRTLIPLDGEWLELWHDDLLRIVPQWDTHRLELTLRNGTPFALQGPSVPYLSVALDHVLGTSVST